MNKNNYTYKKLGEVCDAISAGGTPPRTNLKYWKGNIPWVKISNIKEKYVTSCDEYITEEGLNNSSAKIFKKGTILYTIFATIGEVGILDFDASTNQAIAGLTLKKGYDVDFYYHYLKFVKDYMMGLSKGVAQNNINLTILRNLLVPVPPLATQRKIVAELDCLNNIITKKRLQLQDYDSLAQALFHQTFGDPVDNDMGWEVKKLGEVCDVGSSKRIYQSEQTKNGIPFYRISDIVYLINNEIPIPELFISEEKFKELKSQNLVPAKNDILITSRGTLGTCYIIKETDKFYFQDGMISWLKNIDKKILSLFISFLFKNNSFRTQIDKFQSGSTVAYLSISMLKKTNIIVPPLPLQQQFAAKIEAIEAQKARIRQSVAEVQTLLNYTMDKYFG